MTLREFIKRHRDDLNRFAADWDKATAEGHIAPPTTHKRWLSALIAWIKEDSESFSSDQPTTPRGHR
jgi:hypothetical protein